jgi:type I restriction enzyme S subunit
MKHPAYPKYKPSGIDWLGDVPEHWGVKRGRFCQRVNPPSYQLRGLEPDDEVSFVPMEAVGEYGGLDLQRTVQIADAGGGYTEFEDGDVVVAKITPCFENGKGALASGLFNGAAFGTTELHVLRVFPNLERRFLFYLSISSAYRKTGEAEMYGAGGQKRVPPDFCKDFRTPLPPLPEQVTIADYLDRETAKIDALVAKKRELIEKLKEKRTALISRTVTRGLPPDAARAAGLDSNPKLKPSGIDWLGDVPVHWEVTRLGYVVMKVGSGKTPRGGAETYQDEGVMLIRSQNVYDTGLRLEDVVFIGESIDEEMANTRVAEGDVLLNITGASLGRCAIVPRGLPRANVNQHVCIIRPDLRKVVSGFLQRVVSSDVVQSQIFSYETGSSREGLNFQQVRELKIAIPNSTKEQTAIARYLNHETTHLDSLAAKVQNAIERLQEYRTALITAAVTGKIDVREAAA